MSQARAASGFPFRLRLLIERHHGSARAAAKALGMTHPGLLALLSGQSSPRASTLNRIAERYGVSRDWLLAGEGHGPSESGFPSSEARDRWHALVASLKLSAEEKVALFSSPIIGDLAGRFVVPAIRRKESTPRLSEQESLLQAFGGAIQQSEDEELSAWERLFHRWIDVTSVEEVSRCVSDNLELFRNRIHSVEINPLSAKLLRASFEKETPRARSDSGKPAEPSPETEHRAVGRKSESRKR